MGYQLGVDIGGTFTDLFLADGETGELSQVKVATTPADFSRGFLAALDRAIERHGVDPGEVSHLSHGTTVATNAMLEREGATTGLITTAGFRDVTAIGREDRENVYDLSPPKPPTFAERRHRVGVTERVGPDGEVIEPLDEDEVRAAVDELSAGGVESLAVSLLHAYRNGEHERRIAEIARERTDLDVSISSAVMPEIREYERTLSTVVDAYVGPVVGEYVERLEARLDDRGIGATLHLMGANGGVVTPGDLDGRRLRLVNSGPAAGVIGARHAAGTAGFDSIITIDMGGTSADACAVRDGEIETTTEGKIEEIPLRFPQVDVRTIGAGGGSIARLDRAGVLKVGPESAGADPGPACYGRGGTEPTVTDAALDLGYLDPGYFLGGEMELDEAAGRAALESLADDLGEDRTDLAAGVLEVATTNMTGALRLVTVENGYDPREFTLVPYGGAGPLFATRLARSLGIERALVPAAPGVLSARGLLAADERFEFSRSRVLAFDRSNREAAAEIYAGLRERAAEIADPDARIERAADLRYGGQTATLAVDLPDGDLGDAIGTARERFRREYESIYGHVHPDEGIQAVTWRLRATATAGELAAVGAPSEGSVADARKGTREAHAGDGFRAFDVYDRYALPAGASFEGPAVVEESESTTVIGAGADAEVDPRGNLVIELH